jgi:hypothetical protein
VTEYVILEVQEPEANGLHLWQEAARVDARSAAAAIRSALSGENGTPGEFVAVPARSWKPVKVSVETKSTLKFS